MSAGGKLGGKIKGSGKKQTLLSEKFHVMTELAKLSGVSETFLRAVELIQEKATHVEKQKLQDNEYSVSGLAKIIREREKPPTSASDKKTKPVSFENPKTELESEQDNESDKNDSPDKNNKTDLAAGNDKNSGDEYTIYSNSKKTPDPSEESEPQTTTDMIGTTVLSSDSYKAVPNLSENNISSSSRISSITSTSVIDSNETEASPFEKLKDTLMEKSKEILTTETAEDIQSILFAMSHMLNQYKSENIDLEQDV